MNVWQRTSRADRGLATGMVRRMAAGALAAGAALAPAPSAAVPPEAAAPPAAHSVESLMQLEAGLLGAPGRGAQAPAQPRAPDTPELTALYGLGRGLKAEVRVAGRRYLYAAGRARPLAFAADADPYQLLEIAAPCVVLLRGEIRHESCLPSWAGERP